LEVKGSHFFAEWLSVEGHEEHLNSVDEPRIGHSDLGYVYRVRLPNEAIYDFDVGVLREINLATAEHIVTIQLHLIAAAFNASRPASRESLSGDGLTAKVSFILRSAPATKQ
jgi:hypothetical protein